MKVNKLRVLVLGAGFGGLEVASILSQRLGWRLDLTLIDRNDTFFLGSSKLDVMFGRRPAGTVKHSYGRIRKPGVQFRQESVTSIDPLTRKVETTRGTYDADVLVIALGADLDIGATPGLSEAGNEFYSMEGAERLRELLPGFAKGEVLVAVTGFPFKCPPAPSEAALLLHDYLVRQGVRRNCSISLVVPFELPVPPSYGTSRALLKAFKDRQIHYIPEIMVGAIDPGRRVAILDDGSELNFDLFLGIPEHRVPRVLDQSGLVRDEWVPVERNSLRTAFPGVYAIGDVTSVGAPKAGMFAIGAARSAAASILADFMGKEFSSAFNGAGSCYVEFGGGTVGRTDVDFFSNPSPGGLHHQASKELASEKKAVEQGHLERWFGAGV